MMAFSGVSGSIWPALLELFLVRRVRNARVLFESISIFFRCDQYVLRVDQTDLNQDPRLVA